MKPLKRKSVRAAAPSTLGTFLNAVCAKTYQTMNSAVIPVPPTANRLHGTNRKTGKKYLTTEQRKWRDGAGLLVKSCMRKMPKQTPLIVYLYADINHKRDLDNIIKPTLDMLQSAGIINDDRWVDKITAHRCCGSAERQGYMEMEIQVELL